MRKLTSWILALALLLTIMATPILASDISGAQYWATVVISNNSSATTNVATVANISTANLIAGDYLNASANNCVMRNSSGGDVPFQPGYTDSNLWSMWVPSIGADSLRSYILYTGESTGGLIRYFPAASGMTTPDDDTDLELSDNFTIEQKGWVDTTFTLEDFLTYTEVDTTKLTVTATKATAVNVDRDEDVYLYTDKGANFLDSLDVEFEIFISSASLTGAVGGMGIANTIDDIGGFAVTDISVIANREVAGYSIILKRGTAVAQDIYTGAADTPYYCSLLRVAGNDTVTLEIYTDATRATLVDTLTVAGYGATKYRYLYGFVNYNITAAGQDFDGYVQNLDLNKKRLVHKPEAFITYISGTENITSQVIGTSGSVTATGVASGNITVKTTEQPVLTFDGTGDYVHCGADSSLNAGTAFTIIQWVNFAVDDTTEYILAKFDAAGAATYSYRLYRLGASNFMKWNVFRTDGADAGAISTTACIKDEWWMIAATFDVTEAEIFINGVSEHTDDLGGGVKNTTANFTIGCALNGGVAVSEFEGDVGQVWAYSVALSEAEILQHYNGTFTDTTDLVGYWKLDEAGGTKALDYSSETNDGVIVNATWGNEILRLYIDDELEDVEYGASVPDTSNNWSFVENGSMLYLEDQEITIDGVQVQYIEWEYDDVFDDHSAYDNDATPTFRAASSDLDVSANMTAFTPVAEAKAPDYVLGVAPPFIDADALTGNVTAPFTTVPPAGTFPLADVIFAISNATGTPPQLPLLIIAVFCILAASLTMSATIRKSGSGSLIVKIITITAVMGIFIAFGNFGIDFWMLIVFLIISISLAMGSRQIGWQ